LIEINGKKYGVNIDTKLSTEKLIAKIMQDPENPKNMGYFEFIFKDILDPTPTNKEILDLRRSDREKIFNAFATEMELQNKEFKKKRSIL
jgi:hypothetical protein